MLIIDSFTQGSPEWFAAKAGIPSASNFSKIVTSKGEPSKSRTGYMHQLAAEAITGRIEMGYVSANMEEGTKREDESRALYEMIEGVNVSQVAVVYPDEQRRVLCSPDGLVFPGFNGYDLNRCESPYVFDIKDCPSAYGLELKNVLPKTQIERLLNGKLPSEYFHQHQGSMWICGFDRWDFFSCCIREGVKESLPPFKLTVGRNEKFISALALELDKFCLELAQVVRKIKDMG